ncbi:hypothetical protein MRX96_050651 [Rhipicephalus microplus]
MAVGKNGEYRLGTDASWNEYVERLEMSCVTNKITMDEQNRDVLDCCGEAAYGLIVTLVKPTAVRKHLHPTPSELHARFMFYRRNQAGDESVSDNVTALRKLTEDCGFGDKQLPLNIVMRDRFVCGIENEAVQERLLAEQNLTFQVAYDMAVTAEATAQQRRDYATRDETRQNRARAYFKPSESKKKPRQKVPVHYC